MAALAAGAQEGWQYLSFAESGIYGAGVDRAHAIARGLKPAKTITVALIGFGLDVDHRDVKASIWNNPKEKPNGRDDDGDGRIDDLHGWNFLGNATTTLNAISREGDREFMRLREKYGQDGIVVGDMVYRYDAQAGKLVEAPWPENREEFEYFRRLIPESELAQGYMGITLAKGVVAFIHDLDRRLRQKFPGKRLTQQDFASIVDKKRATEFEKNMYDLVALMFVSTGADSWDKVVEYADTKYVPYQERGYERLLQKTRLDDRRTVGDDVHNLNDTRYGNNNLKAENAGYGTMLAGIVGAKPGGEEGVNGVATNVRIMSLRVDAGARDESYVKDVALAIRYAVDRGAEIIQLGRSNTLYPPEGRWVDEALRHAEEKGVLVVQPVMDYSYNLDDQPFYPNRHVAGGELTNMITVAASDESGAPLKTVNFSPTELDLFAPGVNIKSTCADGAYALGTGSAYAAAMVTGTAALIKSYYPHIGPAAMRRLIMSSVNPNGDAEVEKQFYQYRNGQRGRLVTDLFLFSELSATGGVLDAGKALAAAADIK